MLIFSCVKQKIFENYPVIGNKPANFSYVHMCPIPSNIGGPIVKLKNIAEELIK